MAALEVKHEPVRPVVRRRYGHQIPPEIVDDPQLKAAMSALPANYNFEVHKTLWRIQQAKASRVALQFPEGLLMYACTLSDIISECARARASVHLRRGARSCAKLPRGASATDFAAARRA